MPPHRRTGDALRAVDGLVHTHLQASPVDARLLANLAVAMVTEYSGANRGSLLLDGGAGLRVEFALGPGLEPAEHGPAHDQALVDQAAAERRIVRSAGGLAAPILIGGRARGVIYLEAGSTPLDDEVASLVSAAATRIATLLHNASLLEDSARRARNVETLEALGACLSAGVLSDDHLAQAIDAAKNATASSEAMLGVFDAGGELLDLHVRGADPERTRDLGREVARNLLDPDPTVLARLLGEPAMQQSLGGDLLALARPGAAASTPLGFLVVRRPAGPPYSEHEVTVFRALAHLLAAALARLAYYRKAAQDTLTGTGSRLALEMAIVEAVEHTGVRNQTLAVMLVDIDRFKTINDTYGHLVGDTILKTVADLLRSRLRAGDFVARFGGDEFLVLLPNTGAGEAESVAEELRQLVAERGFGVSGLSVSLSIGIASFPADGKTPRELVQRADEALYASKAAGRNRVTRAS